MDWFFLLCSFVSILLAFSIHEYAHGLTAYSLGDPTPKYEGRLTPNPLVHLDPIGAVVMLLTIISTHGRLVLGWAKPVKAEMDNLKGGFTDLAIVAAAGPASNFVVAFCFGVLFNLRLVPAALVVPCYTMVLCNLAMCLFNCLPWPPLDGWKMVGGFMPRTTARNMQNFEHRVGIYSVMLLLVLSPFVVNPILGPMFDVLMPLFTGGSRI